MASAGVRLLIDRLEAEVYCAECVPPIPVEVRANVFYRLRDHDPIKCPNGHQGTLRDYKYAVANPGERSGPFVLQQQAGQARRPPDKAR